ncbi:hypothetical protein [Sphingopyxis macrogoltabida]|uniref:Uncharacterized protein n=1 Tax=Sphingopyxis macrogoltabida TaxID=33050 RepID=A0AAC8YZ38_SPHMC|nr:hypothetical protein [Sphingopyxis macrogoltabida]ALJ13620.1 hypothetical protein LH19_12140 [Sphingopyxis macrogoltabida]AMU88935.1 hypothetical protein ATM17_07745 [Sphingopyxis macrogoltabida]
MTAIVTSARIEAQRDRLFDLLPAHIRAADAAEGYPLLALLQILAGGFAEVDAEIDTLYDGMFAETAPEAMLADLAALIAAEPLQPLPEGTGQSMRAYIANTLRYRRGKGTARVLEALASDAGGFGAAAVEYYARLARLAHMADIRPERPALAAPVAGGTAAATATAFDRLARLVDVRSIARAGGRHHVPNVGVHLLRPVAPEFAGPTGVGPFSEADLAGVPPARPWRIGGQVRAGYYQLAPVEGEVLRLFNPDRRSQDAEGRVVESDLADRLKRLPLHLETEELRESALEGRPARLDDSPWFDGLSRPFAIYLGRTVSGTMRYTRVPPERILIANLDAPPADPTVRTAATRAHRWYTNGPTAPVQHNGTSPIDCGFDPVTGRLIVADGVAVEAVRIAHAAGIGRETGAGPHDRNAADVPFELIDSPQGSIVVWLVGASDDPPPAGVQIAATLADALAAWNSQDRSGKRGFIVLRTCGREGGAGLTARLVAGSELHIVAARWVSPQVRPDIAVDTARLGYLVRQARQFAIDAPLKAEAQAAGGGRLVLDGLILTAGLALEDSAVADLAVRHCTLRAPGATALASTGPLAGGRVEIADSITGPVKLDGSEGGGLVIRDTIVAADGLAGLTIDADGVDADWRNMTLIGSAAVKSIEATNCLFMGPVTAQRTQAGCVRYSWIADDSSLPRRFRCQPDLALAAAAERKSAGLTDAEKATVRLGVQPTLLDTALSEPTLAMLHPMTGDAIARGGEGDSEMGAFSRAAATLRMGNVRSLFDDYLPFGNEAGLIDDTRSSAVSMRRNRP